MRPLSVITLTIGTMFVIASAFSAGRWKKLNNDGLHDPANPSIKILQEPAEALRVLQPDSAGNGVDWVAALQLGEISPRGSLHGDVEQEILDLDIVMTETWPLPGVIFPHRPHSEWMSCSTCHEGIFVSEIGANEINMRRILEGQSCGRCHGAVSFPLTECNRCHSVTLENSGRAPASGAAIEPEQ